MIQNSFLGTINNAVRDRGIIQWKSFGVDIAKRTAHCFRQGVAQNIFVTDVAIAVARFEMVRWIG